MRLIIYLVALLALVSVCTYAGAFELAKQTDKSGDKAVMTSVGYPKMELIRVETNKTGVVNLTGNVSVTGTANIVMWAKVDGGYYFSKLPGLQNLKDIENLKFSIPFTSPEKPVTELIIEVELMGGGRVEFENIKVDNG